MRFSTALMALAAAASSVVAVADNTVRFITKDDAKRTIYFVPAVGHGAMDPVECNNSEEKVVVFDYKWQGMFYAVQEGGTNTGKGMLGEVQFNGWNPEDEEKGKTYFDVSAIDAPEDKDNVKLMYPAEAQEPTSGCEVFPCDNAYYLPDDVQTKVTEESNLITILG